MALLDRPRFAWLNEMAEERLGVALVTRGERERSALMEQEFIELAGDAEDLALHSMDYFTGGRPSEMSVERRKRIAQRSRVALKFDPLAGAEAQLLGDFAFGKGVPTPTAREKKVQQIIDEAWSDANNAEKLTGFMAQRKLSNELLTTGELFTTMYTAGGRVRVGRLDPDTVEAIVPDPEDRLRPLWYMAYERRFDWDFTADRAKVGDFITLENGVRKVRYWKHWRNYDDALAERDAGMVDDTEKNLITPPEDKQAKGVVFHVAINQTGEELRGNPPWARALRFQNAMNVLTEAHVAMAQAASTFVAKRSMIGTPKTVARAAGAVLGHLSELGASRLGTGEEQGFGLGETSPFAPGAGQPPAPGSWWSENQASKLEGLSLNSGAAQMTQTAQIVRAPIAAAAGFGQHYLGDASNANLATASTLELPATMRIESWQECFAQIYRWFTDRAIEAAVKAGRLGGQVGNLADGPLGEMRLDEAEDRQKMETRTGLDLSYEFVMPFPGRRQLPEVEQFVAGICTSMDPNGVNIPLRRQFLRFAFEAMGVQDVGRAVNECIPDGGVEGGIGPTMDPAKQQLQSPPGTTPAGDGPPPASGDQPKNVKTQSTPPGEKPMTQAEWIPAELRQAAAELEAETAETFRRMVGDQAIVATLGLIEPEPAATASNGRA